MAQNDGQRRSLFEDLTMYLTYTIFIATIGPFQFGYHLAELNAPQDVITCTKNRISSPAPSTTAVSSSSLPQCIKMSTAQFAVVSSIYTLGGLSGALAAGPTCNKYGRLITMRITALFTILGPVVEAIAANIPVFVLGRIFSGLGAGAAIVVVPIYIAEVAPPSKKGLFGAFTQVMINVGILTSQLLGYFLSHDSSWRLILSTAGFVGVAQLLALFTIPESPKWLTEHNHPERARKILRKLRGHNADLDAEAKTWTIDASNADIEEEESLLSETSSHSHTSHKTPSGAHPTENIGILAALLSPQYRPAIIAVVAVMTTQQLTGINSIVMYSVSLLSSLLPTTAALLTVCVSALNVIITTACAPLSDKIGRKTCLLISIAGMGTSSLLLGLGILRQIKPLSALATLTFVASFGVGLGPVPFILANELVGPEAVGATQSWALAANWIATFVVSQFFPVVNEALGRGKVYFVFAGVAVLAGAFVAWWVPETRGKSGVEEVWGRGNVKSGSGGMGTRKRGEREE